MLSQTENCGSHFRFIAPNSLEDGRPVVEGVGKNMDSRVFVTNKLAISPNFRFVHSRSLLGLFKTVNSGFGDSPFISSQ